MQDHVPASSPDAVDELLTKELAELDEHAASLFKRLTDVARERPGFCLRRAPAGQVRGKPMACGDLANRHVPAGTDETLPQRSPRMRHRAVPQPVPHRGELPG